MSLRPEWTHVDAVIAEGLRWLAADDQPPEALIQHHGKGGHAGGGLGIQFAVNARVGPPQRGMFHVPRARRLAERPHSRLSKSGVVIFHLGHTVDVEDLPHDQWDQYRSAPFTKDEIDTLRERLVSHGAKLTDEWNGAGLNTASFALASSNVSRSLGRATAMYHEGCPEHDTVFCGGWQASRGEENCTFMPAGFAALVPPSFPDVPLPAPAAPAPAREDRNLEQVLRAIERGRPVMEQFDIIGKVVVPGVRGHAEDGEFVEDGGYGVTLPAEVYDEIVRRLRIADELGLM